jgi:hypothetical protein
MDRGITGEGNKGIWSISHRCAHPEEIKILSLAYFNDLPAAIFWFMLEDCK